jgi:hypothetical protein
MYDEDVAYFSKRASEERERAKHAASPEIAQIHLTLATKYDALSKRAKGTPAHQEDRENLEQAKPTGDSSEGSPPHLTHPAQLSL